MINNQFTMKIFPQERTLEIENKEVELLLKFKYFGINFPSVNIVEEEKK